MRVVGLTGGIGSGKSEIAKMFTALGAAVIDADVLAREAVEPGTPALEAITTRFGREILDGSGRLDRKKLAALCNPANYLGLSGVMVDRVLSRVDPR